MSTNEVNWEFRQNKFDMFVSSCGHFDVSSIGDFPIFKN